MAEIDFNGHWTFENWNCMLSAYIYPQSAQPVVGQDKVEQVCKQTQTTRLLVLVLLCVAVARLILAVCVWRRKVTKAKREERAAMFGIASELGSGHNNKSAGIREKATEMQTDSSVYELPAYRMSRVEAGGDGYREMEGDGGGREMLGHEVAVELPDHMSPGRRRSI